MPIYLPIIITIICVFYTIFLPIIANITTPSNLKDWYTGKFRISLVISLLILCAIVWVFYFII